MQSLRSSKLKKFEFKLPKTRFRHLDLLISGFLILHDMNKFTNVTTIIDNDEIKNFKLNDNGIVMDLPKGVKARRLLNTIFDNCEYCGQKKDKIKCDCCGASS